MGGTRWAAVLGMTLATALGAQVAVEAPGSPVPITLQTVFVMAAGLLLGARDGALSQVLYVLLAAIGLPVLTGGAGGLGAVTGPSVGYLVGFVVAPPLCAAADTRWQPRLGMASGLAAALIGHAGVLLCGGVGLVVLGSDPAKAWSGGIVPFLPGALLKSAIAAGLVLALGRLGTGRGADSARME